MIQIYIGMKHTLGMDGVTAASVVLIALFFSLF
jgi:hypothetical protein